MPSRPILPRGRALALGALARVVWVSYRPQGLDAGLLLFAATAATWGAVGFVRRRRAASASS